VATAGGGLHLYFRAPDDAWLTNTAGRLGTRIDTRAGLDASPERGEQSDGVVGVSVSDVEAREVDQGFECEAGKRRGPGPQ